VRPDIQPLKGPRSGNQADIPAVLLGQDGQWRDGETGFFKVNV
jgi:hypothetical protein